ncbi:MAG: isoprenylcysteine carboxylmethyltransferase family protein [Actinomycetota bacterium]
MSERAVGWAFVAVQAALLVTLVALPGGDDWSTSGATGTVGDVVVVVGFVLMAVGALGLGRSLTPTPVPVDGGELRTSGPYRFVRHPIYTAVLLVVAGLTLRSGSWPTVAVAMATLVFFHVKAAWEERRLAERYPGYDAYARSTPRFVPRPGR